MEARMIKRVLFLVLFFSTIQFFTGCGNLKPSQDSENSDAIKGEISIVEEEEQSAITNIINENSFESNSSPYYPDWNDKEAKTDGGGKGEYLDSKEKEDRDSSHTDENVIEDKDVKEADDNENYPEDKSTDSGDGDQPSKLADNERSDEEVINFNDKNFENCVKLVLGIPEDEDGI